MDNVMGEPQPPGNRPACHMTAAEASHPRRSVWPCRTRRRARRRCVGAGKVAGTIEAWALLAGVLGRHAVAARAALGLHHEDALARRIRMTVLVSSASSTCYGTGRDTNARFGNWYGVTACDAVFCVGTV